MYKKYKQMDYLISVTNLILFIVIEISYSKSLLGTIFIILSALLIIVGLHAYDVIKQTNKSTYVATLSSFIPLCFAFGSQGEPFSALFMLLPALMLNSGLITDKDGNKKLMDVFSIAGIAFLYILIKMFFITGETENKFSEFTYTITEIIFFIEMVCVNDLLCLSQKTDDKKYKIVKAKAGIDPLTGLNNRQNLKKHIESLTKKISPFSVIMMDIDDFKKANDTYGHTEGDRILKDLAAILKSKEEENNKAYRYGGEEFCMICEKINSKEAYKLAETIRENFSATAYSFKEASDIHFTISLGITDFHYEKNKNVEDIIKKADEALYESKQTGKNKTTVF